MASITWVPASKGNVAQLGVLHGTGPKAMERLVDGEVKPPMGWVAVQDHSKRGLLFSLPADAPASVIVDFAVTTMFVKAPGSNCALEF